MWGICHARVVRSARHRIRLPARAGHYITCRVISRAGARRACAGSYRFSCAWGGEAGGATCRRMAMASNGQRTAQRNRCSRLRRPACWSCGRLPAVCRLSTCGGHTPTHQPQPVQRAGLITGSAFAGGAGRAPGAWRGRRGRWSRWRAGRGTVWSRLQPRSRLAQAATGWVGDERAGRFCALRPYCPSCGRRAITCVSRRRLSAMVTWVRHAGRLGLNIST